jgi:hypothetical protein
MEKVTRTRRFHMYTAQQRDRGVKLRSMLQPYSRTWSRVEGVCFIDRTFDAPRFASPSSPFPLAPSSPPPTGTNTYTRSECRQSWRLRWLSGRAESELERGR